MKPARDSVRCVIVDDHAMLIDLIAAALGDVPGLVVTATGTDVVDADRLAALSRVDLLICDRQLKTGDGMEVVRRVKASHPDMKCIVIAGVTADFVCPPDLLDVVVSVVDKAHASALFMAEVARVTGVSMEAAGGSLSADQMRSRLTDREWQVFEALGDGLSNKELGGRFGISTRTVETHRKAIAKKLGVSGAALVRLAVLQRRGGGDPRARRARGASASGRAEGDA